MGLEGNICMPYMVNITNILALIRLALMHLKR